MEFSADSLDIDVTEEIATIAVAVDDVVHRTLRRRGAVVAVSGGIDSAACAALCVRALGAARVQLIALPEASSSPESLELAEELAVALGADLLVDDLAAALAGAGCYDRQLTAIRQAVPEYGDGWKHKLSMPSILEGDRLNVTRLTVEDPTGEQRTVRMPPAAYLQLVAATNYKQRLRTTTAYYHADRLNYAVCGTPNRLEYDQGFFVKLGDGAADVKPIAHLYKSQVYAMAEYLGVPEAIRSRPSTTDTYSLAQSQEEFYFSLPYERMDLCLYGKNNGVPIEDVSKATGLTPEQVERVYRDIDQKRKTTAYLHLQPELAVEVLEISHSLR